MLSAACLPQVWAKACISLQASWEQVNSSNCPNHVLRTKSSIKKQIIVRRTVRSMFGEQTFAQLRTGLTLTHTLLGIADGDHANNGVIMTKNITTSSYVVSVQFDAQVNNLSNKDIKNQVVQSVYHVSHPYTSCLKIPTPSRHKNIHQGVPMRQALQAWC